MQQYPPGLHQLPLAEPAVPPGLAGRGTPPGVDEPPVRLVPAALPPRQRPVTLGPPVTPGPTGARRRRPDPAGGSVMRCVFPAMAGRPVPDHRPDLKETP
jgi:hypothetical protein